ncbi:MAG TPA: hypothetical protein VGM67_13325 [Gemmatimonadaceae bacterium]|jgi:hypothetical protein
MNHPRLVSAATLALIAVALPAAAHAQDRGKRPEPPDQHQLPPDQQRQRAQEQEQRTTQYKQHLDQQMHTVQQRTAQLQQQKRAAQARAQADYETRLRQQQQQLAVARNYATDPYVRTAPSYRYTIAGAARETNQYGVDVLHTAVNDGYREGLRAGAADHADHWKFDYQNSPEYQDADYGYSGQYVDLSDYNYYFRQGFQRGYSDGYYSRTQYGSSTNGILANLVTGILGLVSLH